jgi:hypothetical protein
VLGMSLTSAATDDSRPLYSGSGSHRAAMSAPSPTTRVPTIASGNAQWRVMDATREAPRILPLHARHHSAAQGHTTRWAQLLLAPLGRTRSHHLLGIFWSIIFLSYTRTTIAMRSADSTRRLSARRVGFVSSGETGLSSAYQKGNHVVLLVYIHFLTINTTYRVNSTW